MFSFDISQRISTTVIKSNAIQVFILSMLSLLLQSIWPVLCLAVDFGLRAFNLGKVSPLTLISKRVVIPVFRHEGILVTLAPKSFAARIGFALTSISFIYYQFGINEGFLIPLILLAVFSFLEAFFGFCAGCKIYSLFIRWKIFNEEDCRDCQIDS